MPKEIKQKVINSLPEKLSLAKEQQKTKPKPEDLFPGLLEGGVREAAMGFVAWLRGNKLNPSWRCANGWVVKFKAKNVINLNVGSRAYPGGIMAGRWRIGPPLELLRGDIRHEFEDEQSYSEFKEFIWSHVNYCTSCVGCGPGRTRVVLGKKFELVCNGFVIFTNPDEKTLEYVKKMIEFEKNRLKKLL